MLGLCILSCVRVLHGFLGIRRMIRVLHAQIRDLCGVGKGINERMENDRIAKGMYVGE